MNAAEFLKRLPDSAKEERALVETAFSIVSTLRQKAADIRNDVNLSDAGKSGKIRQEAGGGLLQHLKQIRDRAASMSADTNNLRKAIKPNTPDRTDLYTQAEQAELRAWLRGLPQAERVRAVLEDPKIGEAVLHTPPALSGLSTEIHQRVVDAHVERELGPQLKGIQQREELVDTINSAIQVATNQFCREGGLNEGDI